MITLICKECGSILYTFKSIPGGKTEEVIQVPPCRECLDRQYDLGYSKGLDKAQQVITAELMSMEEK